MTRFFTDIEKENVPIQYRDVKATTRVYFYLIHLESEFPDENKLHPERF